MRHIYLALVISAFIATLIGCSGSQQVAVYPVKGRALYNGKPATGAQVFFHPAGSSLPKGVEMVPNGIVGPDGEFAVTTFLPGDGAPVGEYIVGIRWAKQAVSEDQDTGEDRLKGRYSAEKSPIRFTVKEGENTMPDIQVK